MITCDICDRVIAYRSTVLVLLQLWLTNGAYSEDSQIPGTTLTVDNALFTFTNKSTWMEADGHCQHLGPDSRLAVLDDFLDRLTEFVKTLPLRDNQSFWIAGRQNHSDSYWTWLDGSNLDPPPENGDCLALNSTMIKAIPCSTESRYYACGFNDSQCPSKGENLYSTTQRKCIKLFNIPDIQISSTQTWYEARTNCISKNGSLAKITDVNITQDYLIYIGGHRCHHWWWAYNNDSGIKSMSLNVTSTRPRDQCLALSGKGLIGVNCSEQHFVLCKVYVDLNLAVAPSSEYKIFLILGIMIGVFLGLLLIIPDLSGV